MEKFEKSKIAEDLELTLHIAFVEARQKRLEFITVEHLLLALLDNPIAANVLRACAANIEELRGKLTEYVNSNTPIVVDTEELDTQPTLGFQRVVQRAILHVQSSGKKEVTGANALLGIFGEKDSHAVYFLNQQDVTRLDVANYISHGIVKPSRSAEQEPARDESSFVELVKSELPPLSGDRIKKSTSPKLFISYSHADEACLKRLLVHLRPLERSKAVVCWSDKQIRSGDKWRMEIEKILNEAAIAVLLISADFLASDFIVNNELPPLLLKSEAHGVRILPVILKPCGFLRDPVLSNFQAIHDPSVPLLALDHIQQEGLYNKIADAIAEEISGRSGS